MLKSLKLVTVTLIVLVGGTFLLEVTNADAFFRELFGFAVIGFLYVLMLSDNYSNKKDYK